MSVARNDNKHPEVLETDVGIPVVYHLDHFDVLRLAALYGQSPHAQVSPATADTPT